MSLIPIQCSISGYGGKPSTLFSAYDPDKGILAVSVETDYKTERRDGCVVISNAAHIPHDVLFTEDDLESAIKAYYSLDGGITTEGAKRLVFSDKVKRSVPRIEKDGMDKNGPRYRVAEDITNTQIACLATALYAATQAGMVEQCLDMANEIMALNGIGTVLKGGIFTI